MLFLVPLRSAAAAAVAAAAVAAAVAAAGGLGVAQIPTGPPHHDRSFAPKSAEGLAYLDQSVGGFLACRAPLRMLVGLLEGVCGCGCCGCCCFRCSRCFGRPCCWTVGCHLLVDVAGTFFRVHTGIRVK